jgi:hypothetical protein
MVVLEQVTFLRKDPAHEWRELVLYQDEGHLSVWEATGFVENKDLWQRKLIHSGPESEIKRQFAEKVERLREEGFTICDSTTAAHWRTVIRLPAQ